MSLEGSLDIVRIEPSIGRTVTYYDVGFAPLGVRPNPATGYRAVGVSGVSRLLKRLGIDGFRLADALEALATAGHVTIGSVRLDELLRTQLRL